MFADPAKILKSFGLREKDIVADLGAGTGFYSILAGHMVPQGKVYAIEVVKDFLQTITNKVKDAALKNVDCFWGDVEKLGGTKIADQVVTAIIASNILFQVEDKERFLEEAKRILKQGGRVLLIDWESDTDQVVPGGAVPKIKAKEMFEKKGFKFDREIDAGAHHYGMIFTLNEIK